MAKSGITITLKGFDDLFERLREAGKDVDKAAQKAIREGARVMETELRSEAEASGVPESITREIRTKITSKDDRYTAAVGWELDGYDPRNPSAGYEAIFLNYGTVRRKTRRGKNRGAISKKAPEQQFIARAKKRAKAKIKKQQKKVLEEAIEE